MLRVPALHDIHPTLGRIEVMRRKPALSALAKRRLLERLDLLCSSGVGLEAIASQACTIIRDLVGAQSGSIFWREGNGRPAGFFHDCAPAELKDQFVTRFDELFSAPGEFNMVTFIENTGESIGRMLTTEIRDKFLSSNVYKYLCVPLDHHHCLDMRLDHEGRGMALVVLWNGKGQPFGQNDVLSLRQPQALLEQAIRTQHPEVAWRSQGSRTAHFITDLSGTALLAIDPEAESLLSRTHFLRQNVSVAGDVRVAPLFAVNLAAMLNCGVPAELSLPAANGRLVVRGVRSRCIDGDRQMQMLVSVDFEMAANVLVVDRLFGLSLTMLQKQIVLFAVQGGVRADCEDRFNVSQESLKKNLRAIYKATGTVNWADLRERFQAD
jgi:hypothetical protein